MSAVSYRFARQTVVLALLLGLAGPLWAQEQPAEPAKTLVAPAENQETPQEREARIARQQEAVQTAGKALGIMFLVWVFLGFILYFVPSVIASTRKHPNRGTIFLLNFLLGWTAIGWLAMLIWAFVGQPEPPKNGRNLA